MKLAVVGSRSFRDFDLLEKTLKKVCSDYVVDSFVSGGAVGADSMGLMFAKDNNIPSDVYFPDWEQGRHAGFIRNTKIAEEADILVAFWDGRSNGTKDVIGKAENLGKIVIVQLFDCG